MGERQKSDSLEQYDSLSLLTRGRAPPPVHVCCVNCDVVMVMVMVIDSALVRSLQSTARSFRSATPCSLIMRATPTTAAESDDAWWPSRLLLPWPLRPAAGVDLAVVLQVLARNAVDPAGPMPGLHGGGNLLVHLLGPGARWCSGAR